MASLGLAMYRGKKMYDDERQRRADMEQTRKERAEWDARKGDRDAQADAATAEAKVRTAEAKNYFSQANELLRKYDEDAKVVALRGKEILNKYIYDIEGGNSDAVAHAVTELAGGEWMVDPADKDGFANGLNLVSRKNPDRKKTFVDPTDAIYSLTELAMGPDGVAKRAGGKIAARIENQKDLQAHKREMDKLHREYKYKAVIQGLKNEGSQLEQYDAVLSRHMADAGYTKSKETGLFVDGNGVAAPSEVIQAAANSSKKDIAAYHDKKGKGFSLHAAGIDRVVSEQKAAAVAADRAAKAQAEADAEREKLSAALGVMAKDAPVSETSPAPGTQGRAVQRAAEGAARVDKARGVVGTNPQGAMVPLFQSGGPLHQEDAELAQGTWQDGDFSSISNPTYR